MSALYGPVSASAGLPLKEIPGTYGLPLLGAVKDRLDYFWFQGADQFFRSRMDKYKSTVLRVNMPPSPPGFRVDPRVVMLLDSKSFSTLFDLSKVDKKNVLTGDYMASTEFTGGYRTLVYLDPSEDQHAELKRFVIEILRRNSNEWIPDFHVSIEQTWLTLEKQLGEKGKADFAESIKQCIFNFFCRCFLDRDRAAEGIASLGENGPDLARNWLAPQVLPTARIGLPQPLEEILFRTFPIPFALVRNDYKRLHTLIDTYASNALDLAQQEFGLARDVTSNNLLFILGFNAYGGSLILFPSIIRAIANAGAPLHKQLAREVREAVKANGGLNMKAIGDMALLQSTVYEVLRMEPPVPLQYGRAKADFTLESHDCSYRIKKGELLGGYQPLATRDPKVFDDPHQFIASRFLGEDGQKLIKYVYWSNGPENQEPTVNNKQCGGKDLVVLIARLLVAELFVRYDTFEIESNPSAVVITSLTKASF